MVITTTPQRGQKKLQMEFPKEWTSLFGIYQWTSSTDDKHILLNIPSSGLYQDKVCTMIQYQAVDV